MKRERCENWVEVGEKKKDFYTLICYIIKFLYLNDQNKSWNSIQN